MHIGRHKHSCVGCRWRQLIVWILSQVSGLLVYLHFCMFSRDLPIGQSSSYSYFELIYEHRQHMSFVACSLMDVYWAALHSLKQIIIGISYPEILEEKYNYGWLTVWCPWSLFIVMATFCPAALSSACGLCWVDCIFILIKFFKMTCVFPFSFHWAVKIVWWVTSHHLASWTKLRFNMVNRGRISMQG